MIPIDGYSDISIIDVRSESRTRSRVVNLGPFTPASVPLPAPHSARPTNNRQQLTGVRYKHGHLAQRSRPQNTVGRRTLLEPSEFNNRLQRRLTTTSEDYKQNLLVWCICELIDLN